MGKITLDVPDDLLAYADEEAFVTGVDRSDFVVGLLRDHRARQELRNRLVASMKSGRAGFADDKYFEELIEQAEAEAARRAQGGFSR
ncbi:hypothetical protein [Roseateles sp. MS654]|uniref:hypothetical protein n=1 Tax=Roseateles sp. MS654 TaxID=3412685 RepID=UPI003C2EEE13